MSVVRSVFALLSKSERKGAWMLLALMIVGMILETFGIGLIVPAIALLMEKNIGARYPEIGPALHFLGNPTQTQLVVGGMLSLVAIYLIKAVFLAFLTWRQLKFVFDLQARLSQQLFTTYLRQPYTFHLQRNSAQLIRNAVTEVSQFTGSGVSPAMLLLTEGLVIVGVASLLLVVEPIGAVIVVAVLAAAAWGFHKITKARITRWGKARQLHDGLRIQHLQQGLGGAKDVKLLGREADFLNQYFVHNFQLARVARLQGTLKELPRLWLEVLAVMGLAVLVLTMVWQGRDITTIMPTLGLFSVAAFRLMPSVNRVLGAAQSMRFALPAIKTLQDELSLPAPEPAQREAVIEFKTRIELNDVSYRYAGASGLALDGLSMKIRKGESVGFVGPSGSGKSTLVDVILGLLTPIEGTVSVDEKDIQQGLRAWQDQIGYVPQSIYLTDDTLSRNVAFGLSRDQIDNEAVVRAVKAAQLEEFVASLPDGLETVVGERGTRLSGGQRQRIGIARALYHDPQVLVLDEATSALDTATERGVMEAIYALHGSKTILVVAHRLSTVEHCDRLFRLEHGKTTEESFELSVHQA